MRTLLTLSLLVALFGCTIAENVFVTTQNCLNGRCLECINGRCHYGSNREVSEEQQNENNAESANNIRIASASFLRCLPAAHVDIGTSFAAASARRIRSW
ncbi:hypothetical protein PMAYCL1PPCAC_14620 [Pristionchus mayeri]|uniref:Uncharacterized protein n=1 Tax=Pristionchus mayeri TaxID=1317129 RepID=A0AAN4ZUT8_9BILA|nr:hypothetical protein PMAYCL1PPCAC_14620 [Pristionchus mayeri]